MPFVNASNDPNSEYLSDGITGRQLSIAPGNSVREMYIDGNAMVNNEIWTPQTLAARIHELLHEEPAFAGLRKPPLMAS